MPASCTRSCPRLSSGKILPACCVTGSCQRLALLRECPPAFGLLLDFASQSKSLAGSCWLGLGESPLIGLLYDWGRFLPAKSAASKRGLCASSYYFHSDYFTTAAKLGLCPQVRHIVSSADGCMPSERFQCTHCMSALGVHPSAASNQPRVAKQINPLRCSYETSIQILGRPEQPPFFPVGRQPSHQPSSGGFASCSYRTTWPAFTAQRRHHLGRRHHRRCATPPER